MSLQLPFGIRSVVPIANIDERYGPYQSIEDALIGTQGTRFIGLTVGVVIEGSIIEYWFKSGISDEALIPKIQEQSALPLILTQAGQRPTIPNPPTITPDDNRFDKSTDLMVGQLAYNVVDNEWYYRGYSSIQTLLKASTITVEQVETWQDDKTYKAGNIFVSFVNIYSPDEQFQSEAIYRCKETTLIGQSPETHPEKWVYQGQNVTVDPTTVIETITIETASSYNPMKEGGYTEGSIISYKNEASLDPQFQTLELYLANSDIAMGVSPEDSTEWIFKGQEVVQQITYPTVRIKNSTSTMQAIVNNVDGDITIIRTSGEIYEFDSEATSGIKPDNILATDPGRWILAAPHKVGEAPIDGQQYARKDGGWEAVESGDTSKWEDESETLIRPKGGKKVDASHIEGLEQGGHTILDPAENTMPTQPALQFGVGFTVTDEVGKTVIENTAASHVDGAVEEKHQTNQVYEGSTPLSTILPQLVNLADIDMSDIIVGEKKILVAEKGSDGLPQFGGAIGLLDVLAPPTIDTLLDESNSLWVGDYITVTGDNRQGQLGENSQFFEKNGDLFLCKTHDNGTTASNGWATWARNRGQDCLKPESIALHATIVGQLETESGWNAIAQFKQIVAESKRGSWFRRLTGGYLFMCIDDANGWTRVGTPPTVELEITISSHPNLTTSLAAHDFTTNRFYVEGTNATDESAQQGQEWWDTSNKYVYRRNMNGNWAKLN